MERGPTIANLHYAEEPEVDTVPGPKSRQLIERQSKRDTNAIYPTKVPLAFDSGKGATVKDVDGNVFLDFFAGIGVLNVGHSNPYVLEGVHEQVDSFIHTIDFPTEVRLDFVDALAEIAPTGLSENSRIVFGGPTGTDAIEGTIKLAKDTTGGTGLIAFRGGYHGTSPGSLSLSSTRAYKEDYAPLLPDVVHLPYPYPYRQGLSPEEAVKRSLRQVRETIEDPYSGLSNPAGIWVEPIQGTGGVVVPPEGFLSGLKEIASENGIPLIADEIQTGLGRTGQWFATDWDDTTPDAMPLAKALGGAGLPISATLYHEDWDTWEAGSHVGTFRGHAPAMVAGTRAIEYIRAHDLLTHAREMGRYIRERLREVDSPHIGEVRGKGLMIGVEFVTEEGTPDGDFLADVRTDCYENGVLVWSAGRAGHVLRLLPPLVLTRRQAEVGSEIIADAIRRVTNTRR